MCVCICTHTHTHIQIYRYIENGGGGLNSLESRYLQTVITLKVRLNNTIKWSYQCAKTPRNIGLLCAVLKVKSFIL